MNQKFKRLYAAITTIILLLSSINIGLARQSVSRPGPQADQKTPALPNHNAQQPQPTPTPPEREQMAAMPQGDTNDARLDQLVEAALNANPDLIAMRREFDAARARIPQAKALPDPMLSFGNNTQVNPIPFSGLKGDFSEIYVGVSQDLPWFGARRLRGQIASAEAEAKFAEYASSARRLTADVKIAYYDLYYAERALTVIARDKEILEKIAEVAKARYEVGKAQQVDVINVQVEITELMHLQGELETKRAIAIAKLNQLLFREPETPIGPITQVRPGPEPPALEELERLAFENAPELKQQRRLIDAGNKAVRLAEREAKYPEVGLSFTYHSRPAFGDYYTYGVTLRLPLYAYAKQRYAIEEQTANVAAAKSRLASNEAMIRYRLREARVRATTAARLIKLHEQGLIPQGTLALESALSAYQIGQADFPTALTALRRVLDYETRYYELLTDYQKALAEMEMFTGVELTK
jgi:outer membrane protein TolC